jgi:hypothetical protein
MAPTPCCSAYCGRLWSFSFGGRVDRGWSGNAAGKVFRDADKLSDFPDFIRIGFAREFLPHFQYYWIKCEQPMAIEGCV